MRTLRSCILLLQFLFAVPVAAGSAAPPDMAVKKVDSGILYLGGTKLTAPYTLAVRDLKIVANGYSFAPVPPPEMSPASPQVLSISRVCSVGRQLYDEGRAKGRTDHQILEAWRDTCLANPDVASATIRGRRISIRTRQGLTIMDELPGGPEPALPPRGKVLEDLLDDIEEVLRLGGAVFLTDEACIGAGAEHIAEFESAVRKTKRGEALTPEEESFLPEGCQKLIRNPLKLVRIP